MSALLDLWRKTPRPGTLPPPARASRVILCFESTLGRRVARRVSMRRSSSEFWRLRPEFCLCIRFLPECCFCMRFLPDDCFCRRFLPDDCFCKRFLPDDCFCSRFRPDDCLARAARLRPESCLVRLLFESCFTRLLFEPCFVRLRPDSCLTKLRLIALRFMLSHNFSMASLYAFRSPTWGVCALFDGGGVTTPSRIPCWTPTWGTWAEFTLILFVGIPCMSISFGIGCIPFGIAGCICMGTVMFVGTVMFAGTGRFPGMAPR
mmetsp:Transcript_18365/g.42529  ORF Transcript_18365/g.42529 Transcript_18365/m.42529 type:complete len:262 (+) Transcript_18365:1663-2448(+)